MMCIRVAKFMSAVLGVAGICMAQDPHDGAVEHESNTVHEEHAAHRNHAALFGGATFHDGHAYGTVGLDYEFLYHPMGGVVALAELVFADPAEQIYGLGLAYHPIPPVKVAVIPAYAMADGHGEYLTRGNLEYAIHAGPVTVSPSVSVDYMAEEFLYVAGLAVGTGF